VLQHSPLVVFVFVSFHKITERPSSSDRANKSMLAHLLVCAQRIAMDSLLLNMAGSTMDPEQAAVLSPIASTSAAAAGEATPSTAPAATSIQSNLATIRAAMQNIGFDNLGLPCTMESIISNLSRSSAIQFFEVLEHPSISVCLIAFPPGSSIPLHDHPGMHVFTKVMSGQLSMTMLDVDAPLPRSSIPLGTSVCVQNLRTSTFNLGDCCELSPVIGNIHGVTCTGGGAALMLDVNIPPYSDDACHYFASTDSCDQLCVIDESMAWSSADASARSQASTLQTSKSTSKARASRGKQKR
jgi:hypothetical protein